MTYRHIVVSYDVVHNLRRARLAKYLKGHLERVQKSVFEGEVTERTLEALRGGMAKHINQEEDTIRIYALCERCIAGVEIIGTGVFIERPDEDVLV
jgi:CRISPR-associated protein Cas2